MSAAIQPDLLPPENVPETAPPAPVSVPTANSANQITGSVAHELPAESDWQQLRQLLLSPEQRQIEQLLNRFTVAERHAQEVSEVLPSAVLLRTARDRRLAKALQPTFEEALRVSINKDPKPFIDAVAPAMGAAIRRAIAEALSAMMASLNRTLDNSISPRSLKWRWESFRTGRPFAEVVFLNTVAYRVEQVFLIHRETGLLLLHAQNIGQDAIEDADMVSGMLTAIQDFVRDSFGVSTNETLDTMKVGDLTVWVEQGPQALLAGVVRGAAPSELRLILQDALDSIHIDFHDALKKFEGDATPFEACRPYLESCLQVRYQQKTETANAARASKIKLAVGTVLALLLVSGFFYGRHYRRWRNYLAHLQTQPGIVVVEANHGFWRSEIKGLRDPLAADPDGLLTPHGLDAAQISRHWMEYYALEPQFIIQRAQRLLEPPASVQLTYSKGTLYANGMASPEWLFEARKLARGLAGVTSFVSDQDALQASVAAIESILITFPLGRADLTPEAQTQIKGVAATWQRVNQMQPDAYYIEVSGNADPTGSPQINATLKRERAAAVRQALLTSGCTPEQLRLNEMTNDNNAARRVSFQIKRR